MREFIKKSLILSLLAILSLFSFKVSAFFSEEKAASLDFSNQSKSVTISDNGLVFDIYTNKDESVGDFLRENRITLGKYDSVVPDADAAIASGMNIMIERSSEVEIQADGKTIKTHTFQKDIRKILLENNIVLGRLDKTSPEKNTPISDRMTIAVTRINIEEVVIPEDIAFKTTTKTDSKLGWREKRTDQKGENGVQEVKYRITYKNGKEISRVALEKNLIKDPVQEIITQGTFVKLGDKHTGFGTWYSFKGGLYAASPWLPIGSFAKVTNVSNGKSVIVEINDRGPFGKNRIIDLDKEAFERISGLGAGVISIKVEEVLN